MDHRHDGTIVQGDNLTTAVSCCFVAIIWFPRKDLAPELPPVAASYPMD